MRARSAAVLVFSVAAVGLATLEALARPIVLLGTVVDGTGRSAIPNGAVVVDGESIVAVGPRSGVAVPADAVVFEVVDGTILPGFINAHVHNAQDLGLLTTWVQSGVTTVRDLGAPAMAMSRYTGEARSEPADACSATVLAAGPIITARGAAPSGFPCAEVGLVNSAQVWVRTLADWGADVIKIMLESTIRPVLSPEIMAAVVQTAHSLGVPVSAHVSVLSDLERVVAAGVDDIAHIVEDEVPASLMQTMIGRGITWIPTLVSEGNGTYIASLGRTVRAYLDLGGTVAIGNDTGYLGFDIGMPMDEIRCLANVMTPMEVIVAGTQGGAKALRQQALLGTLEVGKRADVLIVQGDPLTDLEALSHPLLVIHRGAIVRQDVESRP